EVDDDPCVAALRVVDARQRDLPRGGDGDAAAVLLEHHRRHRGHGVLVLHEEDSRTHRLGGRVLRRRRALIAHGGMLGARSSAGGACAETSSRRSSSSMRSQSVDRMWVRASSETYAAGEDPIPDATAESQGSAQRIAEILGELESLLGELEPELGQMDAIAGDGDHGKGMVIGSRAARSAAQRAVDRGSGARTVLVQAGAAWSAEAGGTSGALWGAALTSVGSAFQDDRA